MKPAEQNLEQWAAGLPRTGPQRVSRESMARVSAAVSERIALKGRRKRSLAWFWSPVIATGAVAGLTAFVFWSNQLTPKNSIPAKSTDPLIACFSTDAADSSLAQITKSDLDSMFDSMESEFGTSKSTVTNYVMDDLDFDVDNALNQMTAAQRAEIIRQMSTDTPVGLERITMKQVLLLVLSLLAVGAFAQPDLLPGGPPGDPKWREDMESVMIARLTRILEITPDQAKEFFPLLNEFQKKNETLRKERNESLKRLKQLGNQDTKATQSDVDRSLKAMRESFNNQIEATSVFVDKASKVLQPWQTARLQVFVIRLPDRIEEMVRERMKENHGRRWRGGPDNEPPSPSDLPPAGDEP